MARYQVTVVVIGEAPKRGQDEEEGAVEAPTRREPDPNRLTINQTASIEADSPVNALADLVVTARNVLEDQGLTEISYRSCNVELSRNQA